MRKSLGLAAADARQGGGAMFRGDGARTGVYHTPGVERFGGIQWRFQSGGMVQSSAAVTDGIVYIGSGDGNLYALDAATGAERWRFAAGRAITSSPAVAGGVVYFGSRDNRFFAVDARSGKERWQVTTGADAPLAWGFESGDLYTSSPVWSDGLVVFGSGDGRVHAVDDRTGAVRWRFATEGRVRSSPAILDGRVYVGSMDGTLYALELRGGRLAWRFDTEGHRLRSGDFGFDRRTIQSSPAAADGRVFVGSRDGFLYAVDAASGRLLWRVDHHMSWVNTSPAVAGDLVFAGSSDERFLQAVDVRTGKERCRVKTERPVWSSPAVAGDLVYVGDGSGTVYALDRASGAERWRHQSGRRILSSPVPHDGLLYVGNDDGGIYAIRDAIAPLERAVFWDSTLVRATRLATHVEMRDYFRERGYEVVDATALRRFMERRVTDRAPSVVVFAMDHLPASVAPSGPNQGPFRRYLDAGGKVVWAGIPPLIWPRDPKTGDAGDYSRIDRESTRRLLDVDHARSNFDGYGAAVTPEGLRWGLSGWWESNWSVDPGQVSEPLALDDNGLAGAWVKNYGGPPGTGFVRVYGGGWMGGGPSANFAAVQAVAEYRPR
ncbi:MAG: PQQ-binding-like beta-propeller repeat protein [Gemmatimonadales bacterium]|nr:PQQ-binding-like beta-propeller repeat protein [Gemmatimonadales bacterium]